MSKEVRDKLAVLEAKMVLDDDGRWINQTNIPDDLNTCAAMWDKYAGRLVLCMHVAYLTARERNGKGVKAIKRTGTDAASELRDRWRLLWEVLKARGVV